MDYPELRLDILETFAEAQQHPVRTPRLNLPLYDLRRTKHRALVLGQELDLRVRLRTDVQLRVCYRCLRRAEWRLGCSQLALHACIGGRMQAPPWPCPDVTLIRGLKDQGHSNRSIARAVGLTHVTVARILRAGA